MVLRQPRCMRKSLGVAMAPPQVMGRRAVLSRRPQVMAGILRPWSNLCDGPVRRRALAWSPYSSGVTYQRFRIVILLTCLDWRTFRLA